MIDQGKKNVLGVWVDAVDYQAAVSRIIVAARRRKAMAVTALAVHGIMSGVLDPEHLYRLNHLDLVVPDGQPVRWALNWLYQTRLVDRVYGPKLMLQTCEHASEEGLPIYLYGSNRNVVQTLSDNLQLRFPRLAIAGSQPSRFRRLSAEEKRATVEEISESCAAVTFVGLGCPRQEVWVYEYRDVLSMPLVAVGAAFDFHAGTLPQAPWAMQNLGLEWLYRFVKEPRRLWKRYALLNPLYLILLASQVLGVKRFDPLRATPPTEELRYG